MILPRLEYGADQQAWADSLTRLVQDKLNELEQKIADLEGKLLTAVVLPVYTVATVPNAMIWANSLIYVSDGAGNLRVAYSNGTEWRWVSTTQTTTVS